MKHSPTDIGLVAEELCQLTPVELDAFVQELPDFAAKWSGVRSIEVMGEIAITLLAHESLGDAFARIEKYKEDQ
jgi:hypothetical protein